jgi:hypothetical protein
VLDRTKFGTDIAGFEDLYTQEKEELSNWREVADARDKQRQEQQTQQQEGWKKTMNSHIAAVRDETFENETMKGLLEINPTIADEYTDVLTRAAGLAENAYTPKQIIHAVGNAFVLRKMADGLAADLDAQEVENTALKAKIAELEAFVGEKASSTARVSSEGKPAEKAGNGAVPGFDDFVVGG